MAVFQSWYNVVYNVRIGLIRTFSDKNAIDRDLPISLTKFLVSSTRKLFLSWRSQLLITAIGIHFSSPLASETPSKFPSNLCA